MRALWDKVEKEYEACSCVISDEMTTDELPTIQAKYDYCYLLYEQCSAQLSEQIADASQALNQPQAVQFMSTGCRLPPCDTEVFGGDYTRWPTFRDLFTAIYIQNPRLSEVKKLFYLNSKTSFVAHAIVSKSPLTNEGFQSAWFSLTERFEHKRLLVNSQLRILFNLPAIGQESHLPLRKVVQARVSGLTQAVAAQPRKFCQFLIGSQVRPDLQIEASAYVLPQLAGNLPSCSVPQTLLENLPSIQLADPKFFESSQIDVLLGADILPSILLGGSYPNICGTLLGQETIFGWILTGPVSGSISKSIASFAARLSVERTPPLEELLSKFWEVEDLPASPAKESDLFCEAKFNATAVRTFTGRYMVTLPFRDPGHVDLGHSRATALAQFLRNESRLKRNDSLKEQYDSVIQEYLDLGHMTQVPPSSSGNYYLPHHAVLKPDSTTTKLRVVFNASHAAVSAIDELRTALETVLVISSEIPIDLKARERRRTWLKRQNNRESDNDPREETMQHWQDRWTNEATGRWTAKQIPDVKIWSNRDFGEVNYYLTQLLSGHGYFAKYLHQRGLRQQPSCVYGDADIDDAEHTFFSCTQWQTEKELLESQIDGIWRPQNVAKLLVSNKQNWKIITIHVERILRRKKRRLDAGETMS
ncbi:hypothetical protein KR215_009167 [Drosophila sulfurigaster]|nr:hypothetical protein KR215_009167 [Drosophila sulfurigaster]